jgi:hypothetical protein
MRRVLRPKQRLWVISTLLVALLVRALIPAGFMPASDRPFSFQVCPDGFPAALLSDAAADRFGAAAGDEAAHPALTGHAGAGPTHAGYQHGIDGGLAHAGHHHDIESALTHAGHHHVDGLMAGHHHDGPAHNHSSANAEHCVFAAAAGAFALVFLATFSAPADNLSAPDVPYVSPALESHRFRIPQPRGPPALS